MDKDEAEIELKVQEEEALKAKDEILKTAKEASKTQEKLEVDKKALEKAKSERKTAGEELMAAIAKFSKSSTAENAKLLGTASSKVKKLDEELDKQT